ncbi:hypothetical protein LEP1GSC043_0606 [Leptospira weilii str. Ecochallenge]|uniref:Uncharacterized protein n=1 Tax=Leptospira weilii str. Ecochallenge TaxID=1049986 RepID=N1UF11_9LEPT|nr:hypothetical protein LEP1GSC043_0606 [Leptospira weilii str. Ecochallenge]
MIHSGFEIFITLVVALICVWLFFQKMWDLLYFREVFHILKILKLFFSWYRFCM